MVLALLANILPPLVQILNANRAAYSSSVGTGANRMGAYPFDQEIVDAVLRADGHVVTEGYFHSKMSLRKRFLVASANIANAGQLPEFQGLIGKAEYSIDGVVWKASVQASRDDVAGAAAQGSYVGVTSFAGHHFIDEGEGIAYHTSPFFRIEHPSYTRTTVLQASQSHDAAIIAWALTFLYKERSNAAFEHYKGLADFLLERVIAGSMKMNSYMPKAMPGGNG